MALKVCHNDGVTFIADRTFSGCSGLTSVTIIGGYAKENNILYEFTAK